MDRSLVELEPRSLNEEIALRQIQGHRSTTDWQFTTAAWSLDTVNYVSSPSSLHIYDNAGAVVLKHSVSGPIAEGRIVDCLRFYRSRAITFRRSYYFRNQWPDGSTTPISFYTVGLTASTNAYDQPLDRATLQCWDAGTNPLSVQKAISPTLAQNTWHRMRITWWVSAGVLIVRLEYFQDPNWVPMCEDWTDAANRFYLSGINRIGVGIVSLIGTDIHTWHDDTEAWIKAT